MHVTMDSFELYLLKHRRVLIAFMEEWSRQEENIVAKYACDRDSAFRPEGTAQAKQETAPTAEEPWVLFSEQVVLTGSPPVDERAEASQNMTPPATAKPNVEVAVPSDPAIDSRQLPADISEIEGIQAALQPATKGYSSVSLRVNLSSFSVADGGFLKALVESSVFTFGISAVILSNVVFMAIAADSVLEAAQNGVRQTDTYIFVGDVIFTSIYVIELALKLACYGRGFFFGFEWQWHIFDMVVVFAALVDVLAPLFLPTSFNLSYLRVNRLVKLVKMMRVVTIYRAFKELRLIIAAILGCVKTMFWAIVLLATVLFTFSLLFVQAVTEHVKNTDSDVWNEEVLKHWGSTRKAMLALFQSSTGGEDWARVAEPLWDLGWLYYAAFMLYICFFMFIVVNILTALFVDAALGHSMKEDSILIEEEIEQKQEYINLVKDLFRRLDDDGSNELTWEEFARGLHSPDMLAFASALDIEIANIHEFFRLISNDGRKAVDLDSFVVGCMKLRGAAKSLDVVSLIHTAKHLEHMTSAFATKMSGEFLEVKQLVSRVLYEQERTKETAFGLDPARNMETIQEKPTAEKSDRQGAILNGGVIPSHHRRSLLASDFTVP